MVINNNIADHLNGDPKRSNAPPIRQDDSLFDQFFQLSPGTTEASPGPQSDVPVSHTTHNQFTSGLMGTSSDGDALNSQRYPNLNLELTSNTSFITPQPVQYSQTSTNDAYSSINVPNEGTSKEISQNLDWITEAESNTHNINFGMPVEQSFLPPASVPSTASVSTPPFIISTPPTDENPSAQYPNFNINQQQVIGDQSNFLQPNFQGSQFEQLRQLSNAGSLSDLSSVDGGSPYLSAYSGSNYGGDDVHSNVLLEDLNGDSTEQNPQIDFLSLQLDSLSQNGVLPVTPVTISVDEAPEDVAERTPSLFSSNASSRNNSPNHSRNGSMHSTTIKSGHFSDLLSPDMGESYNNSHGGSNSSDNGSVNGENELLRPDSHKEMRAGRQRRHSTSRSNSRSVSRERSPSVNREKMLELASTNQGKKRTQKNPAIVACHLCDKKFTRNYNLNSHLRTHANERPFECTLCHRTFVRQYDMNRHMALHSGEKKYECRGTLKDGVTVWGCGKRFARTDALGRHFKTEAGKECIRPLVEENERERMAQKEANPEQIEEKS